MIQNRDDFVVAEESNLMDHWTTLSLHPGECATSRVSMFVCANHFEGRALCAWSMWLVPVWIG